MTDATLIERLQSLIESEGKSCSFDPELITPEYVYRMWGGSVAKEQGDGYLFHRKTKLVIINS